MMTAPREGDFSPAGYERIVREALAAGYRVGCFRDYVPGEQPALILRHDLDHSLRSAAAMGRLEREIGVRGTYFIQVTCEFYNLFSHESREVLANLVEGRHEIGLHYDSRRYASNNGDAQFRRDLRLLEELAETEIVSGSQHIPIDTPAFPIGAHLTIDAYHPRYTKDVEYISDSLMQWRQAHPLDLIDKRRSMQLLTHPINWMHSAATIEEALGSAEEEEIAYVRSVYERTRQYYTSLLANRRSLDEAYRKRQGVGHLEEDD